MNYEPFPTAKKPTSRDLTKARTREHLLAVARSLFAQRGFQDTTMRDIALQAGLSTGAIFASFENKAQLLEEILAHDRAAILLAMQIGRATAANIIDVLSEMLGARLDHYADKRPLLRAALDGEWMRDPDSLAKAAQAADHVRAEISAALGEAVANRELSSDINLPLVSSLLCDISLAALRRAALTRDDLSHIKSCQRLRLKIVLKGYQRQACRGDSRPGDKDVTVLVRQVSGGLGALGLPIANSSQTALPRSAR